MKNYTEFLPNYTVGEDCYKEIPSIVERFGKKAVVVGGHTAMEKAKSELLNGVNGSEIIILGFVWYGGDSTYENVEMLKNSDLVKKADMIFAVGGGRAVDTCKVLSDQLDKVLFTFPTIASNCAACTSVSVMYNSDHTFKDYYYERQPAEHTFINTKIIAEAPENLLWAGIGDALSKEPEVLLATRNKNLSHTALLGAELSKACGNPLLKYGEKALNDCKESRSSYELEQVVLDIIISTGIVSNLTSNSKEYYNSSLAHAFYYGSTLVKSAEQHLHGEVVSFGVLCLLTYDKQFEKRAEIIKFNKKVGLPVCLSDIEITEEDVIKVVEKASEVLEWECTPYKMDKELFKKAILETDEYGINM